MKIVNIEESNMKLAITEQRALTGDCLRTGGPNWCHIGLLDNKQSTIIFNKYCHIGNYHTLRNWCHYSTSGATLTCWMAGIIAIRLH